MIDYTDEEMARMEHGESKDGAPNWVFSCCECGEIFHLTIGKHFPGWKGPVKSLAKACAACMARPHA